MEALEAVLRAKTLEQIERLERRVVRDTEEQVALGEKRKEIADLKKRVEDMTKRRNDLQQKLKHFPTDSLRAKVLKDTVVEGVHATALPPHLQEELEYLLVAHRCAGTTARILKKGRVRIQFETTYRGEYFEPFYLELEFTGKEIEYRWHTLPAFIPLSGLTAKYNDGEIQFRVLLCMLHSYVSAFVQRRQQTMELSGKYAEYLGEEISSLYAYNFIQLVLNIPAKGSGGRTELVVHLYYKELQSDLPTRVRCSDPGDLPVHRGRIKQAFLTLPLAEAFQNLFLDQNIEQG
ncbi:Centromere protein O [Geodia barretti]|uniref:Centromere protein O n=1 Tax=Geodia barretti TaxID=519541 RepID=A0AA35QXG3_GEOBA|nr:Centromere protein O [Geodia barretti]